MPLGAYDLSVGRLGQKLLYMYSSRVWIMNVSGENQKVISTKHTDVESASLSPDGNYIVYVRKNSKGDYYKNIYFYDLKTKKTHELDAHEIFNPSPHGTHLYQGAGGSISWIKTP